MRIPSTLAQLAALLTFANASSSVLESLISVPEGWREVGKPAPSTRLHFRIAMAQPDDLFEQTLYDMSNPQHSNYGNHLKRDQLKDMLRPSSEATDAVLNWLSESGVAQSAVQEDGEWINFVATVETAQEMMNTSFSIYRNALTNTEKARTLSYSVPQALHQYVDMIQPTTRFGQMRPQMSQIFDSKTLGQATGRTMATGAFNATACNTSITPTCLDGLYNIDRSVVQSGEGGFAAFNNFLKEYPRYSDLATFEKEYAPYAVGKSFNWTSVDGGLLSQNDTADDSGEANLDAQYLLSIGYPVPIHAYSTAGNGPIVPDLDQPTAAEGDNEPYLDFLTYILAQSDAELPHTLTTSYGEDEQSVPLAYRKRVCSMIGQLGARGVSVLFSSGDTGVGSACQTNDGKNTTRFMPVFPAACPYVTSVGGTRMVEPEEAVSFSSGGFSDTWARPAYQEAAVSAYLSKLGSTWDGLYNQSGRGFPDVAAQAYDYHVIDKGQESQFSGTSCASPTFAGVIALLNAYLIQNGKSPLGFLNPWIYSKGYKGLTDIVNGGSRGCTGYDYYSDLPTPLVPYASWNATAGWDPVTGYGTPDFSKLLAIVKNTTTA